MSGIPTSRCPVTRHPVVKNPDTNNKQGITSKNNMKIAKKENQSEVTMMIRLDCQFPVSLNQSGHACKLPVIQF